jgi:hypothetical protein
VAPAEINTSSAGAAGRPHSAQPEAGGVAVERCRAWLSWAAAQLDACLTSDQQASAELLAALADMLSPAQSPAGSAARAGDADGKMSAVIIAVQSHDRVMQGLVHVAESLRTLEAQLGDAQRAESAESWRDLSETQIRSFSMPQERELFARMLAMSEDAERKPDEAERKPEEADVDPEGTIELFTIDPDLHEP